MVSSESITFGADHVQSPCLEKSLDRFFDLPPLARWKALLIEYGVDFESPLLFNDLENIFLYKTKRRTLKPVARDLKVFDESEETSLIPSEITIRQGEKASIVKLGYRPDSPIQIDVNEGKKIVLREKATQRI